MPARNRGGKLRSMPQKPRPQPEARAFRVLVAVHRPRYKNRVERALSLFDWEIRSLLNKEDPVGLIQQKPPHLFFISPDFGRQKDLGIVRAVQKFRGSGMLIIGIMADEAESHAAPDLFDYTVVPPWKSQDIRELSADLHTRMRGEAPKTKPLGFLNDEEDEY